MSASWRIAGLLTVTLGLVGGCSDRPELVPVSGTVYYKGKPVETGVVMFQPDVGGIGRSRIGPDGRYSLETLEQGEGVIPGMHKVRVSVRAKPPGFGGEVGLGKLLIPEKYIHFDQSGLTFDVTADRTEPYDIHLAD